MLNVFQRAENALYKYENDISRITDYVQSDILARTPQESHVKNIAESGYDFLTQLEKRQKAGGGLPGIATGFVDIDTMLGGLEDGKLYVIGGRPSMGKTALALNVATEISKNGKTVMLFSLEMGNYEIMKRIMAAETEVKSTRIKMAKVLDDDYLAIATALEKFMPNSLFIDDNGDQSIQRIASTCIGMNTRLSGDGRRIDCVVIDHLQLIGWEGKMVDRRMQIGFISRTAKKLAKKLECPIILLSQLNRAMAGRKDNRPMLSDLRESGDIEQDADAVIFIHREEYYNPTENNHGKADIIIAKNRDGECGSVELGWDKSITKFKPWEEYSAASKTGAKPKKKPKYYENNDEDRYTQEKMEV